MGDTDGDDRRRYVRRSGPTVGINDSLYMCRCSLHIGPSSGRLGDVNTALLHLLLLLHILLLAFDDTIVSSTSRRSILNPKGDR